MQGTVTNTVPLVGKVPQAFETVLSVRVLEPETVVAKTTGEVVTPFAPIK